MKKVLGIIGIIILVAAGIFGFNYWNNTYRSSTAYAVVPTEVPKKEQTISDGGKKIEGDYSYAYTFNFYDKNGKKTKLDFVLSGSDPKPFTPGSVVKAEISKTRVTNGPSEISKSQVPAKAKSALGI